jgi:hypothetical protein
MKVMPYDDIASFCLAALGITRQGMDLGELSCGVETTTYAVCLDLG